LVKSEISENNLILDEANEEQTKNDRQGRFTCLSCVFAFTY